MARYKAKASKGAVTFVGVMAFLAVVGVLAIALGLASNWGYWIPKKYLPGVGSNDKNDVIAVAPASNMTIEQTDNSGIMLLSAPMALSDFEAYDVSPYADNVQTLTATLTPPDTTLQKVDFSVDWKNPNSTWATGKNILDYIQLSQATDGALTCAVSALQPFGEQAIITCTARALQEGDNVPSATCTVDYYKRITSADVVFWGAYEGNTEYEITLTNNGTVTYTDSVESDEESGSNAVGLDKTYSIGTIFDGEKNFKVTLSISDNVAESIKSAAGINTLGSYELHNGERSGQGCLIKTAIQSILGGASNVESHRTALYNAFKSAYENGTAALKFNITFDADKSGFQYNFDYNLHLNPLALGIKADDVSLDKPGIALSVPIFTNEYILPEYAA